MTQPEAAAIPGTIEAVLPRQPCVFRPVALGVMVRGSRFKG